MKGLLFVLSALILIYQAPLFSQSCLPEGIIFSTQAEINNFQANNPDCTEIEGDVTISGSGITNLAGLNVLTSIGGLLRIFDCDDLTSLSGLENLESIGIDLIISANNILSDLTALENISIIEGKLMIGTYNPFHGYNASLTSLEGLHNIVSVGENCEILNNHALNSLNGLNSLTYIGGDLMMICNYTLPDLEGLANVTFVGDNISICGNSSILNLTGLNNLTSIPGSLTLGNFAFGGNSSLINFSGLENISSIGGDLIINLNHALINLTGLENVVSINGSLTMGSNDILYSLAGLEGLTSIGENLSLGYYTYPVSGATSFTSLSGLDNLNSIGGDLALSYNSTLINLTGLNNLTFIGGNININYNPLLSSCDAQSICDYLANPNGTVEIHDNGNGCNSPEEVEEACQAVFVDEIRISHEISIYPNPTNGISEIKYRIPIDNAVNLSIYDIDGQKISTLVDEEQGAGEYIVRFDGSGLSGGLYLLRFQIGHKVYSYKLIIYK